MFALVSCRGMPAFLFSIAITSFCVAAANASPQEKVVAEKSLVKHLDALEVDPNLNLAKLVNLTLEKFPDMVWLNALEEEAKALRLKGDSLLAGSANAELAFQEATSGTLHYVDARIQVPLWNIGQQNAHKAIARQAESETLSQEDAVKLRVAGLVRGALWNIALANLMHEQAQIEYKVTEALLEKVQRRVDLGDLPRADYLLAQTELLQKRSVLTQAEAELMHARKRYTSITQTNKVPSTYNEKLVALKEVRHNHPALAAVNTQIERKQAEIKALQLVGSGQTSLSVGINSDESSDPRSNKTESFNIGVIVPFGGATHLAPQVAAVHVALSKLMAEREQLIRDLDQAHHEAEHNMEVNEAEMEIANDLRLVAEEHLKMTNLSFSVGEINLMDLLKIQARTQQAVLNAKQRSLMQQRDIALYNQAVGVMP